MHEQRLHLAADEARLDLRAHEEGEEGGVPADEDVVEGVCSAYELACMYDLVLGAYHRQRQQR